MEPTCCHCGTMLTQKREDGRCVICGNPCGLRECEFDPFSLQSGPKRTRIVKLIGYWAPTSIGYGGVKSSQFDQLENGSYPDIRRAVRPGWREDIRDRLRDYLRGGHEVSSYLGYSSCRFDCRFNFQLLGKSELSDGEWIWPEGLVHYIERHDVHLPDEFVRSIEDRLFEIPAFSPEDYSYEVSESLWIDWAKQLPPLGRAQSLVEKSPGTTCLYLDPGQIDESGDRDLDAQFDEYIDDVWTPVLKEFPEREIGLGVEWVVSDVPLKRLDELKRPLLEGLRNYGLSDVVKLLYTRPDPDDWHKDQDIVLQLDQS